MAKDDLHVIVYRILQYLYTQLKKGKPVNLEEITPGKNFVIPERYWTYIITELYQLGYIKGISIKKAGGENWTDDMDNIQITYKGVEYLTDDRFMNKVKNQLTGTEDIIPYDD